MKERPILFNGSMVRALLEGRKTKTRRLVKDRSGRGFCIAQIPSVSSELIPVHVENGRGTVIPPPCIPGDRLWVRETFATLAPGSYEEEVPRTVPGQVLRYAANSEDAVLARCNDQRWRPSIHMPRWASRITLEVTEVRIERLQDITEEDAKAEGIESCDGIPGVYLDYLETSAEQLVGTSALGSFRSLWDSIYGGDPDARWSANPWAWVTGFRRVDA